MSKIDANKIQQIEFYLTETASISPVDLNLGAAFSNFEVYGGRLHLIEDKKTGKFTSIKVELTIKASVVEFEDE